METNHHISRIPKAFLSFIKKETVLSLSILLAIISAFMIRPDREYIEYTDYRTIALLFSLMVVVAGLRNQGALSIMGRALISKANSKFKIVLVLVLLCFFFSMLITNDVALITFVPFAVVIMDMLGTQIRKELLLSVIAMQTIAANLGSMLTPLGNPQNLYLYGLSGLSLSKFMLLMLPYTIAALILLVIWALFLCIRPTGLFKGKLAGSRHKVHTDKLMEIPDEAVTIDKIELTSSFKVESKLMTISYVLLFLLCILTVARIVFYPITFVVVLLFAAITDRKSLEMVDYSLLFTFIALFVFIGNLSRIPAFSSLIDGLLTGHEVIAAVIASQVTSNVPAAILLSGFTDKIDQLIIGTNLGGLGTLIASMASLISFRQIAKAENSGKPKYFLIFTVSNIVFLIALSALWWMIK